MDAATTTPASYWTVAYRNPRANRFLRVDRALTWDAANALADRFKAAAPEQEVWVVPNAEWDAANPTHEDCGNILISGKRRKSRVAIKEGGVLPEGVEQDEPAATPEPAEDEPTEEAATDEPTEEADADYGWTIAYRKPRAKRFYRVDLALSEDDADDLASDVITANPTWDVYSMWNRQAELDGLVADEEIGHVSTDDGDFKLVEGGTLPAGITAPGASTAPVATAPVAVEPVAEPAPAPKQKADRKPKADRPAPVTVQAAAADGIQVTRITDNGKRDLVAARNGAVVATAVGYNDVKPSGARWFKGWKIMSADGKTQLGHVVFQVGVAKAEAKLRELAAKQLGLAA